MTFDKDITGIEEKSYPPSEHLDFFPHRKTFTKCQGLTPGLNLVSLTPDTTRGIGEIIGRYLKGGEIICLYGELGTGKTCLTQGIAQGLQVKDPRRVKSPSFILVREYSGTLFLYHIDLYRLSEPQELEELGYEEYLYGEGVAVIEWADKMEKYLPLERIDIYLSYQEESKRRIRILCPDSIDPLLVSALNEYSLSIRERR